MFNKLLPLKRLNVHEGSHRTETTKSKNGGHKLDKSKIRLVILADSDRGRTPFFDSEAIKLVEDVEKKTSSLLRSAPKAVLNKKHGSSASNDSGIPSKDGPKYRFQKLGSDVKVLEEMMFGTVPMAYRGSSLKVHVLRSPNKLMITQIFIPEKPRGDSLCDLESDSMSLVNSMVDLSSGESFSIRKYKEANNKTKPVDVPTTDYSDYGTDEDNGFASFTSSGSLPSSFPSPNNNSLSSYSSLHKRWMRSQTTSFNNHQRKPMVESSLSSEGSSKRGRRQKLGIAILFGSHDEKDEQAVHQFQSFVFSHFTLIEAHVERLRAVIEKAYFNLKTFLLKTVEALDQFRQDVYNLYMAPRLEKPVWLSMMSSPMNRPELCENFMKEFNSLVTHFDKKDCKFFVSTLLSAVLTQHLTWVATVTPAGASPTTKYLEKHSAKWVEALAKTHPYNPLWAQLGDIFGAIGPPLKISRTIVVGKKADLVKRFLHILSYFIRCSDVQERENPCSMRQILSDPPVEEVLSPTLSDKTVINGYSSDDKNSFQSPSCSQQASCGSAGAGFFAGSNNGGEYINMMTLPSSVESVSERTMNYCSEARACMESNEPNVVFCDSSLKNSFSNGINSKHIVIKDDVVFDEHTVPKELIGLVGGCDGGGCDGGGCDGGGGGGGPSITEKHQLEKSEKAPDSLSLPEASLSHQLEIFLHPLEQQVPPPVLSSNSSNVFTLPSNVGDIHEDDTFSVKSSLTEGIPRSNNSVCDSNLGLSEIHTFVPNSVPLCSLTPLRCPIAPTVENVRHVRKAAEPVLMPEDAIQRSESFSEGKSKSRLSQRLEDNPDSKTSSNANKPTTAELRRLYLNGGTSSMFDEYYESDIEAKTADNSAVAHTAPTPSLLRATSVENGKDATDVKSSLTRQLSIQDNKTLSAKAPSGTRGRSITPEMSRRRHLSSTSSIDYDAYDPLTHGREVKLPSVFSDSMQFNVQPFDRNFGRSLLAGFSEKYMSDFVLLGTSDRNFKQKLLDDLQTIAQSSFLDEHIEEAVCVIADTDTWTVEVASSKIMRSSPSGCTTWNYSKLVADLIESVVGIHKLKMGAEFCLLHLEDRLQEIYFKSYILAEYLQDPSKFSQQELTSMLGFESSDMSLLFAVAGTHTPSLLTGP